MKIKKIYYSSKFQKNFKKIPERIQKEMIKKEKLFRQNPLHPLLKTHRLKGKYEKFYSFSLTYSYRILFEFISDERVGFVNIGTHAIYR